MNKGQRINKFVGVNVRLLMTSAILFSFIAVSPAIGFSAESSQISIMAVPLVMTNSVLPTQFMLAENPLVKDDAIVVMGCGSDGAALLIRVSGRD